jgi:hypothetical protein
VFLKQDGKVYLVRDWATLQRWIMEHRVGRDDMVSEGGVNWDTVGSRPELGSFFAALEKIEAAEMAGIGLAGEAFIDDPHTSEAGALSRLNEQTEGVPVGLPPLPTEEIFAVDATPINEDDAYPDLPPLRSLSEVSPLLDPDSESSAIEEALPTTAESEAPVVETSENIPDSKVVSFPDLDFEPPMQQEEVEGVDNPDFAPSLLDLPETGDSDGFGSDFGDFGRFGEGTENQGEKAFDSPPTETDIPLSDPLPDLEEDEFIDPTELAEPSASFDDAFGDNLASDNVNDDDLLAIDNTEVLEPDDPFADFGDFFQDDEPIPPQGGNNRRFMAVGIIAAGAVVGLIGYALYFGFPSADTATQPVATATTAPQEETAPDAKTEDDADGAVADADEATANEADANVDEVNTDEADANVDEVNTDAADEANADAMDEEAQPTVSEPTPPISEPKKTNDRCGQTRCTQTSTSA